MQGPCNAWTSYGQALSAATGLFVCFSLLLPLFTVTLPQPVQQSPCKCEYSLSLSLQANKLWSLFADVEVKLIPILAGVL